MNYLEVCVFCVKMIIMDIKNLNDSFKSNGFNFYHVNSKDDALALAKALIGVNKIVSVGGSVTLEQIGLLNYLQTWYKGKYLDRYHCDDVDKVFHQALFADVYCTSCNAIVKDGSLLFVDGNGNRCAAICYGPSKVLVFASVNKVVDSLDDAIIRVKEIAAPQNASRLNCTVDDIWHMQLHINNGQKGRISLILIDEVCGY